MKVKKIAAVLLAGAMVVGIAGCAKERKKNRLKLRRGYEEGSGIYLQWVSWYLEHEAGEVSDEEMLSKLQEEYEKEFDMTWIGLYGFNNTYAVVTTKEAAISISWRPVPILQKVSINWYSAVIRIILNVQTDSRDFPKRMV